MNGTWYNGGVKLVIEAIIKYLVWELYLCYSIPSSVMP